VRQQQQQGSRHTWFVEEEGEKTKPTTKDGSSVFRFQTSQISSKSAPPLRVGDDDDDDDDGTRRPPSSSAAAARHAGVERRETRKKNNKAKPTA